MKTFTRYFLHFFLIVFTIFFILFILTMFDEKINLNLTAIILYILTMFVYILPMSLFYGHNAELIRLKITNDEDGTNKELINTFIIQEAKRTEKQEQGNGIVYYMKNSYYKWLTNPISVHEEKDNLIIDLPQIYKSRLKKKLTGVEIIS